MEDGGKEDPAQCKEPKFLAKAGWMKKGYGRLLASYKDRFVHVEKTEIVVYENEELQNCLEKVDLESYDKCHELKSPFKRKHRLILIRSPKSANKVHDVKFQTQTAEEKEAWIKALSDGINRAKNKIFDEVKVDDSSNLEHVTRTRPKGNRNRRPPTRIHMKEVADVSSDGILRLDLDLENATMPNGTSHVSVDGPEKTAKTPVAPSKDSNATEKESEQSPEEETKTEPEASPQKKVFKPPMPPNKEAKPSSPSEEEPLKDDGSEKKVLKPPMPPSKEVKPSVSPKEEEASEEDKAEKVPEMSPDSRKKTGPPPTPPNKPVSNLSEAPQSRPNSHPPTPPCKEKKPSHPAEELNQEVQGSAEENKEEEEEEEVKEVTETASETDEAEQSVSKEDDGPQSPSAEGQVSEDKSGEADNEPQEPTEPLAKSPPLVPKKKPEKPAQPDKGEDSNALLQNAPDTSAGSSPAEETPPKSEVPTVVVSVNDPVADSLGLSPLLCHFPGEKKKKAEEKSVDSGQHSDDDSESSVSEDTLAASTAALRGSNAGLDVLDANEDDAPISVTLRQPKVPPKPKVGSKAFPLRRSEPTPPLKPSAKARSASIGDLLSVSSVCTEAGQQTRAEAEDKAMPAEEVVKLEAEVALEIEKTRELLSRVSVEGGDGESVSEDLLTKAMEKLKTADHVLREVKKLTPAKNSSIRKSW
ncbi:pleckstrin homology domain-containing family O member 2 isoform X2 [Labrus mixtus]|uniref:pleckstrin homology domain-containing family O member 2 isoform X2 n=1 Tax=Labrus mixtus TaxID=508554 RepID=UPI0029C02B0E|nr:pleckstrin homology domain-containing family O member 2 isoform X2 [Labrus mixtus]